MEPESESVFRPVYAEDDEDKKNWARPPSSYGSMKSDSDDVDEDDEEDVDLMEEQEQGEEQREEEECNQEVAEAFVSPPPQVHPPSPIVHRDAPVYEGTGMQLVRSESPETLFTMSTQQTKPPGAIVIDTRSDIECNSEDDDKDLDEPLDSRNNSPEPPEPLEYDDGMQMDEYGQPGMLHPEQDLAHVFKTIQNILTSLTKEELLQFKIWFSSWEKQITLQHMMEGDILDFVDRIIEVLGMERALTHTIHTLGGINKQQESEQLHYQCRRALIRWQLKQHLERYYILREGITQAGKQSILDNVFVEPQISIGFHGGFDPSHEFKPQPPTPVQVPSADTFVSVDNLFRLKKQDGQPVRTVVTTGIAGIGKSVCVAKFCWDWTNQKANKDLQFVIDISFRGIWLLRNLHLPPSKKMSIKELINHYHPHCKKMEYLDAEDCKYVIVMDSFDRYQAQLDWKNTPVVNDSNTQEHPDVLIVNLIRGNLLPTARVWIIGRRAAVSQIPSEFIDVVTEVQGFSDEMKDEYLTKRFADAQLAAKIVTQYKRQPTLRILAHHPFTCWIFATVFKRNFYDEDYGVHPPRITPFYLNILLVQMNRRLQFYFGQAEHELKWRDEDKQLVIKVGKMALKMLERNASVFYEDDLKEYSLNVQDVTVFMGIVTEIPSSSQRRTFCFVHFTVQEFMAALYVFTTFREKGNVLESTRSKIFSFKDTKSAATLLHSALDRTLNAPLGQYDMFLRLLCGLVNPDCVHLNGYLYHHHTPKLPGIEEAAKLLEKTIDKAPAERLKNLKECLREMTQNDE
ncbi:NLR family CARD domain-containing protein 3-like [Sphaeramia orbicularis]|uniref:NLR family CARD domain-containing protein 3-like n=1 Tax=Sphaeramia orbicularis TaxID=375764 RepID=A0A673B8P3_9TELE|nr:NLR family CARD domain-containing protein 3-like [Sphaeramia orbicularis]